MYTTSDIRIASSGLCVTIIDSKMVRQEEATLDLERRPAPSKDVNAFPQITDWGIDPQTNRDRLMLDMPRRIFQDQAFQESFPAFVCGQSL
jgi:hypothetical protein